MRQRREPFYTVIAEGVLSHAYFWCQDAYKRWESIQHSAICRALTISICDLCYFFFASLLCLYVVCAGLRHFSFRLGVRMYIVLPWIHKRAHLYCHHTDDIE